MAFWSGYERSVRCDGPALKLWLRRARCGRCGVSHTLVPSFCLLSRLDVATLIAAASSGKDLVDDACAKRRRPR